MTEGTRVVAYLRVSTSEQAESGLSLDSQLAVIQREAEHRGWALVGDERDVESGKSTKRRDGLARALELCRTRKADAIAVTKLDRLSRSVSDFAQLVEQSRREGWGIIALDVGIDMTTPNGEMLAGILAVLGQWERRLVSERTKTALATKRARGERLGAKRVVPDDVRRLIREARMQGMTYRAICDMLTSEGVPTGRGGRWHPQTVKLIATSSEE